MINAVRPDRLLAATRRFVASVMGDEFASLGEQVLDYHTIVNNEVIFCQEIIVIYF